MWAKIRQEREALQIQKKVLIQVTKKIRLLEKPNQVVYILSPSNPKRQALLRKGMESIAKQPYLIFPKSMEPTSCPMSSVP